jgi:hypothetical protein
MRWKTNTAPVRQTTGAAQTNANNSAGNAASFAAFSMPQVVKSGELVSTPTAHRPRPHFEINNDVEARTWQQRT